MATRTQELSGGTGFQELDELVLHLKGLVLVRKLQQRRGADERELSMYGAEIARVRARLAGLLSGDQRAAAEANAD
jgi:hypothetical protein